MSLLTIVQGALSRLNLPAPASVAANTGDKTAVEMFNLAKEEGKSLARRASWKALTSEQTFSATAASAQTGAIPSDLDWIIPDTMFNRTQRRRIDGPIDASAWQAIQATTGVAVFPVFRIRGASLLITPTPSASDAIAYEYITKNWCQSSVAVAQSTWLVDTDTALIDEELHTLGLMWRLMHARGMDWQGHFATYESEVKKAIVREGARPRISTDGPRDRMFFPPGVQGSYRVIPL